MKVGVRELKNRLSSYLERVAQGETVVITERGKPVATISAYRPRLAEDLPDPLGSLVASGEVIDKGPLRIPEGIALLPGEKSMVDFVLEQRR